MGDCCSRASGSRLMFVWGYTRYWPECQADWSLMLMTISWSIAKIPRYLCYTVAQIMPTSDIPYPLFWLRYSLFYCILSLGISGECLQVWAFYRDAEQSDALHYATYLVALMYLVGGPSMVGNMWSNRKRRFKKGAAAGAAKAK